MNAQRNLIEQFYSAFARRDAAAMMACYHPQAHFADPIFTDLRGMQIGMMWHMLCARAGQDFLIRVTHINSEGRYGCADWQASYTFSGSDRRVHNRIHARFEFVEGLIHVHRDHFSLHRWAAQALGVKGLLLGWMPSVQAKIREQAMHHLAHWSSMQPPQQSTCDVAYPSTE